MKLTQEDIERLKSLVRVSMDMNDHDNWKNGEYFGDARKFWEGAMIGVDTWVEQMQKSQNSCIIDEVK